MKKRISSKKMWDTGLGWDDPKYNSNRTQPNLKTHGLISKTQTSKLASGQNGLMGQDGSRLPLTLTNIMNLIN